MKIKNDKITFRPLRENDLPLLHRWFNTPHVSEWWSLDGNNHPTLEEVKTKYTPRILPQTHVDVYIFSYDKKPMGMIQSCNMDDEPAEKAAFGLEDGCVGIDLCIGEEDYVHQGLGSVIIRHFLKEIVFSRENVVACIADPYVENTVAIKCYQKAGFKYLRTIWYEKEGKQEHIFIINRDEIKRQGV
jgi:RimJ/RimL family protein N-acetyltransferase